MFLGVLAIGRFGFCKFEKLLILWKQGSLKCHNFSLCLVREDLQTSDEHIAFIDRVTFC